MVNDLGISNDEFIRHYPKLYHMAESDTWASIEKHGLLSTSALLDLFEITGDRRQSIEGQHRPKSVKIKHSKHGTVVIRDQIPMRESDLHRCLEGMTPAEWYLTLNNKVFFWLTKERLFRLLGARAYRDRKHCVLTVDTAMLLERHSRVLSLTPLNSGCTRPRAWPRGKNTFQRLAEYPFEERRKRVGVANAIAEAAIDRSVPDIADLTIKVQHVRGDRTLETVFQRA
jgi:hypothetical protein